MSKDPAFKFYSQDFLTGTMFFTDEQVGIYIRLLIAQHQLGGLIKRDHFLLKVGKHEVIKEKFIETEDGFYNERLLKEMVLRQKKSTNLSANAQKRWMQMECKSNAIASDLHMPIEPERSNNNIMVSKEIFDLACKNILDQKEFWAGCTQITKRPIPELKTLWTNFVQIRSTVEDFKTAKELKEHFLNWVAKQPKENKSAAHPASVKVKLRD